MTLQRKANFKIPKCFDHLKDDTVGGVYLHTNVAEQIPSTDYVNLETMFTHCEWYWVYRPQAIRCIIVKNLNYIKISIDVKVLPLYEFRLLFIFMLQLLFVKIFCSNMISVEL